MRTDLRFLLPRPPRTVALLGALQAAADDFRQVGLEVVDGPADLALAPADEAERAIRRGHEAIALEGRGGARALERAGFATRRWLALPALARPAQLVPLDAPAPLRYALHHVAGRASRIKAARNRLAPLLLERGLLPGGRALAVGVRAPGPPFLLTAARDAGVPVEGEGFVTTGSSDLLSRGALFVFPPDARDPAWVIKFARLPGARAAFDRDAAGLAVAARAGGSAAAHAPRLLARFDAAGAPAAVETAAHGRQLASLLESSDAFAAKRAAVDRIANWIAAVGRETASSPPAAELARLRRDVLPRYDAAPALLDGLDGLPGVLQHNDLGTWNLVVTRDGFTALDWESARAHGLPIWDLVYFLAYAVVSLDAIAPAERENHLVATFLGRTDASAFVFMHVRAYVDALGIDADAVGKLALTAWLHHGLSHVARERAVRAAGGEPATAGTALPRRLARRWLDEPELGAGWDRWQA